MQRMSRPTGPSEEFSRLPGGLPLERLLEQHQPAVFRLCRRVLRHPQDAEDACQEVLLEVSRQAGSVREPEAFSGWLYRTALRTALDFRRKRGRDRQRQEHARPPAAARPASELSETLYDGLARLDDASRSLIVEHYLAERPLRELAAERGCSEVAVWKKIRNVRDRLRSTIGPAAIAALPAPAGPGFLGWLSLLEGGSAVGGLKLLVVVAPLAAVALVGIYARTSEPPPAAPPPRISGAAAPVPRVAQGEPPPRPASGSDRPAASERSAPASAPAARKPYPYKAATSSAPSGAQWAWSILTGKKMTLDQDNVSLADLLGAITKESGLKFNIDPQLLGRRELISYKVQSISIDGALRLLLQPRSMGYEIQPDGAIHVAPADQIVGGFERAARAAEAPANELALVGRMLDEGWDGIGDPGDLPARGKAALGRKIVLPQGETSLQRELDRLEKSEGLHVRLDLPTPQDLREFKQYQARLNTPFLQPVEERSLGDHLDRLAAREGLVTVPLTQDMFLLTSPEKAEQARAENEARRKAYLGGLDVLQKTLPEGGKLSIQDFVERVQSSQGTTVVPSEEAWNSSAAVTLPPGSTLQKGLEAFRSQGFRWALSDGKLFILK
jgi:RNA polymerase sigma-70 factor (ECF subfamily)